MAATFAQRHWSGFERLAIELTTDCFGVIPTTVFRTRESKDGGFDGAFVHDLGRLGRAVISHETLLEAKLRSGSETVGLRAFAATLIIAFNGRTQSLVVVTNREFSPQALAAARDFQWKSRLQVILIGQKTLSAWVRPRTSELAERYARELLDDLIVANPADEIYQEVQITGGEVVGTEPPARLTSGRLPDGTLAKCAIVLLPPSQAHPIRTVIGRNRREIVGRLTHALRSDAGCVAVIGEGGVGKSHIVRTVLEALPTGRRCLGILDLAQCATSRQLFLAIIAQMLGVEIAEVARQFREPAARRVFSTAGGVSIPSEVRDAILSVLKSHSHMRSEERDIDQIHLTQYLSYAADDTRSGPRLLVFHNLDKTSSEVLEFLHAVLPILTAKNISVLLELAIGGDAPLVGMSQWRAHVELFKRAATLGCFTVPGLDREGAVELLLDELPGLGVDRADFIRERVGNRPLFLRHAALWLKKMSVVAERAHGSHLIEKAETFFEGLRPEACVSVLDRHIDLWRREIDLPYADAITASTLLDGKIAFAAAQLLTPGGVTVESMLDSLVTTGLFAPQARLEGVRVSHSLLLERMVAIERGEVSGYGVRKFDRKRVALLLLSGIDRFTTPGASRDLCRSALLEASEDWSEAWDNAQRAGQALLCESQLTAAAAAFDRAILMTEQMVAEGDLAGSPRRIASLVDFLQVEASRYRLGTEANLIRLESLSVGLRIAPRSEQVSASKDMRLRAQHLSWRAAFTRENFDEALPIARELFATACTLEDIDPELAGRAVAALGITLKAVEQTDESERIFVEGQTRFPTSSYCQMQHWSNLAALALRADPTKAAGLYQQILAEVSERLPLLERLHTEVDLAMALFLADSMKEAATQAHHATNLADANGIPAQGSRGRNILGCIHWAEGRTDDAIALFDRAVLDAERSYMERFLWRFRVNLASVSTEAGQFSGALANARWAEDRLVNARATRWTEISAVASHVTSRWYVALLAIGLIYYRCGASEDGERLSRNLILLPEFHEHLREIVRGSFPSEVFGGTTHRHGNRIMITG